MGEDAKQTPGVENLLVGKVNKHLGLLGGDIIHLPDRNPHKRSDGQFVYKLDQFGGKETSSSTATSSSSPAAEAFNNLGKRGSN